MQLPRPGQWIGQECGAPEDRPEDITSPVLGKRGSYASPAEMCTPSGSVRWTYCRHRLLGSPR